MVDKPGNDSHGGWTFETLYAHFDQRLNDQEKATKEGLAAFTKLVEQAQSNTTKWQEASNEWRGAMNDREEKFVKKEELKGIWIVLIGALTIFGSILGIITFFSSNPNKESHNGNSPSETVSLRTVRSTMDYECKTCWL